MLINVGLLVLRGKLKNKKFKESIYAYLMKINLKNIL